MKKIRILLLALALVLALSSQAQDDPGEIVLVPREDPLFGLVSVVPQGWQLASPGVYSRGDLTQDIAALALQSAPLPPAALLTALRPQFLLDANPEPVGEYQTDRFTWTLYAFTVDLGFAVEISLALANEGGTTYLVLIQAQTDENDALREAVFFPALDAFALISDNASDDDTDLPYRAIDVTFDNPYAEGVTLAGTLTLPEGDGPHPAVILISGSGPQDRDSNLAPAASIRPFFLLADHLTRNGIAVLRHDDRGVGESTGEIDGTLQDYATDTIAALEYLQSRDDIDPARIGLLGHSQGGIIAVMIAAERDGLAFIISMAGPAVDGRNVLLVQNERVLEAGGASREVIELQLGFLPRFFEAIENDDRDAAEQVLLETLAAQYLASVPGATEDAAEAYARQVADAQLETYFGQVWFKSFLNYNPGDDLPLVDVPVLVLLGELDTQVAANQNAPAFEAGLAGNPDATIVIIEGANHLFQAAETGGVEEYALLEPVFIDGFLTTISDWLLQRLTIAD